MTLVTGLSTGIAYHEPIASVLEPISRAGFQRIEVSTGPGHLDLRHLERVGGLHQRIADLGLEVCSLHAPFGPHVDITSPSTEQRLRAMDQLTRAADALQMLGGRLYVIHPGSEDSHWVFEREANLARAAAALNELWAICQERRLVLTIETPLPHLLGGELATLQWLLDRVPSQGTGVCIDSSHTSLGGFLLDAIDRLGKRLIHVQLSDNRGVTDDHLPPGEGIIDWPRVMGALQRVGYSGTLLLELTGSGPIESDLERAARSVKRLLPESSLVTPT